MTQTDSIRQKPPTIPKIATALDDIINRIIKLIRRPGQRLVSQIKGK